MEKGQIPFEHLPPDGRNAIPAARNWFLFELSDDPRRAIQLESVRIRVRKNYEISITLNASFNQVEQLKAVSSYDGAEIFEGISEKEA